VAVGKGREKQNLQLRERKRSVGKEFSEWEQRLKHWGSERISESTLGVRKPGKGSFIFVHIFVGLSSLWCVFLCSLCLVVRWTYDQVWWQNCYVDTWFLWHEPCSELLFCFLYVIITMNWFDVWFKCCDGRIIKEYYFLFLC